MAIKYELHTSADPTVMRIIPELAKEIGLNESIVLLQVAYWIKVGDHEQDGEYWTFQSVRDMHDKAFSYWSVDTVARTVNNLLIKGLLKARADLNQRKSDKTRWFALEVENLGKLTSVTIVQAQEEKQAKPVRPKAVRKSDTPPQDQTGQPQSRTALPQNRTTLPETTKTTTEIKDKEIEPPADPVERQKLAEALFNDAVKSKDANQYTRAYTDAEMEAQKIAMFAKYGQKAETNVNATQ